MEIQKANKPQKVSCWKPRLFTGVRLQLFASSVNWHLLPKHTVLKSQWIMQWYSLLQQPALLIYSLLYFLLCSLWKGLCVDAKKNAVTGGYMRLCLHVQWLSYCSVVQIFQRFWKQTCLYCSKRYDGWIFVLIFVFWWNNIEDLSLYTGLGLFYVSSIVCFWFCLFGIKAKPMWEQLPAIWSCGSTWLVQVWILLYKGGNLRNRKGGGLRWIWVVLV